MFRSFVPIVFMVSVIAGARVCYFNQGLCVSVVDNGDSVNITMTSTTTGWAAVGINTAARMKGADIMIGWVNADGSATISDRKASGESLSVDAKQDLTLLPGSGRDSNGLMTINFQRLKDTGDSNDMVIKNEAQYWIFATCDERPGSSSLSANAAMHDHEIAPKAQNLLLSGIDVIDSGPKTIKAAVAHGALMFLAWQVLVPIGIFIAQFEKPTLGVWWFRIHVASMCLAALFMIIALALMIQENGADFDEGHALIGLIVIVFAVLIQMPLGVIIDKLYNPDRQKVPWHDKLHIWLGRIIGGLSFVAAFTGLSEYRAGWDVKAAWLVWSLGVVLIGGSVVGRFRWKKNGHLAHKVIPDDKPATTAKTV